MLKKEGNICKFVSNVNNDQIVTSNFVYERNLEYTNQKKVLREYAVHLVVEGKGRFVTDLSVKELKAGTVFFTFPNTSFCIENTNELKYMYISFHGSRADVLFERFGISLANCFFEGYEGMISFWENSIGKANEKNLDLISESVLLYTFSQLSDVSGMEITSLVNDILKLVDSHFTNSEMSLEFAATELGYSPKYISRLFKDNIGITFSEYLRNTRIQHAVFLMEQNIISVKNIAFLCGYKDPLYFSNVFKKHVGVSPTEYIKRKSVTLSE